MSNTRRVKRPNVHAQRVALAVDVAGVATQKKHRTD